MLRALILASAVIATSHAGDYCQRGDPCWPTPEEVDALRAELSPNADRQLSWPGEGYPRPAPALLGLGLLAENLGSVLFDKLGFSTFKSFSQPLYGLGESGSEVMNPVVVDDGLGCNDSNLVFQLSQGKFGHETASCIASSRNNPLEGMTAEFVVWPITAKHVQAAVRFAVAHNLCVAVVGTGHDFVNRHSCPNGMYIRTSLLKDSALRDGGKTIRFGAGTTFEEGHHYAATKGKYIASGWCPTVGIAGWSLSGGHGPFAPSKGIGSDNIVEADIVLANGELKTVNKDQNAELWKALRGGGGGWGVLTSLTLRAHDIPTEGFSLAIATWKGNACKKNRGKLEALVDKYSEWIYSLDSSIAGYALVSTKKSWNPFNCGGTYFVQLIYAWPGDSGDAAWEELRSQTLHGSPIAADRNDPPTRYENWWQVVEATDEFEPYNTLPLLEKIKVSAVGNQAIIPQPFLPTGTGPSVLVPRDKVGDNTFATMLKEQLSGSLDGKDKSSSLTIFQDLTGNVDSPQVGDVSVSEGMRKGMLHFVFAGAPEAWRQPGAGYCTLGEHSYQAEASYGGGCSDPAAGGQPWQARFWGQDLYDSLLALKKKVDPKRTFWCKFCVGSEDPTPNPASTPNPTSSPTHEDL